MRISEPRTSDLVGRDVASLVLRIIPDTISSKYWIPYEEEKKFGTKIALSSITNIVKLTSLAKLYTDQIEK